MHETFVANGEPVIGDRLRLGNRVKILVEGRQTAMRREPGQQQARMSAPTEGGVYVVTVRVDLKRSNCFVQQDGLMDPCAVHRLLSERKVFENIGHLALHLLRLLGGVSRRIPELEISAHA